MNIHQRIEAVLADIGSINTISIPGFISTEWPNAEAAEIARVKMNEIGWDGAKVAEVGGSFFCNWEQAWPSRSRCG